MSIQRIYNEVGIAARQFALVEAHPTNEGGVYVRAALQTSVGNTYFMSITFANYPSSMPKVFITRPALAASPHRYPNDQICYLHPNMWNPGRHDLMFVLMRSAKWLNKYEVYRVTGNWPGAEVLH